MATLGTHLPDSSIQFPRVDPGDSSFNLVAPHFSAPEADIYVLEFSHPDERALFERCFVSICEELCNPQKKHMRTTAATFLAFNHYLGSTKCYHIVDQYGPSPEEAPAMFQDSAATLRWAKASLTPETFAGVTTFHVNTSRQECTISTLEQVAGAPNLYARVLNTLKPRMDV